MTYAIRGLDPQAFAHLAGLPSEALAAVGAIRTMADCRPGYPCRVTLEDAESGTPMLLVNHVSHDVANPYRASHAIFVTESGVAAAEFIDRVPDALDRRVLSLRAFSAQGLMVQAVLSQPGEADGAIRQLFANHDVACVHAHNAVRGCFAARVERS